MILATELADQNVATAAVGFIVLGALGVLGFLVRNAFENVSKGLEGLNVKLDSMAKDIARGDGDRRELAAEIRSHAQRLDSKAKRLDRIEARLERLEQHERDSSDGVIR